MHLLVAKQIRRVAISKKKIELIKPGKQKSYEWDDVKSVKLIPFLNMYSLKLKGKKSKIYFLPASDTEAMFGIFSSNSDLIPKKMR
jgi:hypothetical protein